MPMQSPSRPFGLRFAVTPSTTIDIDLDAIDYDEDRQIAMTWSGGQRVPLTDHRMGVTLQSSGEVPREDDIWDKS